MFAFHGVLEDFSFTAKLCDHVFQHLVFNNDQAVLATYTASIRNSPLGLNIPF